MALPVSLAIDKAHFDSNFKEFLVGQKKLFNSASSDTTTPIKNNRLISKKVVVTPAGKLSAMVKVPAAAIDFNLEYTLNEIGSYGNAQEHFGHLCDPINSLRFAGFQKKWKSVSLPWMKPRLQI